MPCGSINNVAEALNLEQVQHRGMVVSFDNSPVKTLGNPIKLSATPVQYRNPPPKLGQDTQEILQNLGFDTHQIQQLIDHKII